MLFFSSKLTSIAVSLSGYRIGCRVLASPNLNYQLMGKTDNAFAVLSDTFLTDTKPVGTVRFRHEGLPFLNAQHIPAAAAIRENKLVIPGKRIASGCLSVLRHYYHGILILLPEELEASQYNCRSKRRSDKVKIIFFQQSLSRILDSYAYVIIAHGTYVCKSAFHYLQGADIGILNLLHDFYRMAFEKIILALG